MTRRIYWLKKAHNGDVQEITEDKAHDLRLHDINHSKKSYQLVSVYDNGDFYVQEGGRGFWIKGAQLSQVLALERGHKGKR